MKNAIPQVDAYIEKSADFAKPILKKIRRLIHKADPRITESLKWGHPAFEHKGLLAGMAAFKQHVTFGFWKQSLLRDSKSANDSAGATDLPERIARTADLPPDKVLIACVKQAVRLNDENVKVPRPKSAATRKSPASVKVPADLAAALAKNKKARDTFEAFSYSNRKEYVEWITTAKQQATRTRRLAQTIEWLAEGKPRNWKYMKKC